MVSKTGFCFVFLHLLSSSAGEKQVEHPICKKKVFHEDQLLIYEFFWNLIVCRKKDFDVFLLTPPLPPRRKINNLHNLHGVSYKTIG